MTVRQIKAETTDIMFGILYALLHRLIVRQILLWQHKQNMHGRLFKNASYLYINYKVRVVLI
jgi:hypothetical protein